MTQPSPTAADTVTSLVAGCITQMFLTASGGNVDRAYEAAVRTINLYGARSEIELFTVARIIAFNIASLGSLGLSALDDLSLPMLLRLRGSACACHRAIVQSEKALQQPQPAPPLPLDTQDEADIIAQATLASQLARQAEARLAQPSQPPAPPQPPQPQPQPQPQLQPQPQPQPQPKIKPQPPANPQPQPPEATGNPMDPEEANRARWASAFATVAQEFAAEIPHLPPAKRWEASVKSQALSTAATEMFAGMGLEAFRLPSTGPADTS